MKKYHPCPPQNITHILKSYDHHPAQNLVWCCKMSRYSSIINSWQVTELNSRLDASNKQGLDFYSALDETKRWHASQTSIVYNPILSVRTANSQLSCGTKYIYGFLAFVMSQMRNKNKIPFIFQQATLC